MVSIVTCKKKKPTQTHRFTCSPPQESLESLECDRMYVIYVISVSQTLLDFTPTVQFQLFRFLLGRGPFCPISSGGNFFVGPSPPVRNGDLKTLTFNSATRRRPVSGSVGFSPMAACEFL